MNDINPIKAALLKCRSLFFGALLFSFVINMLMLATPIYSMQVLDRVLSSGSSNTLLMLTIIVVAALLFTGILQVLRSLIFAQIGRWLADHLSDNIIDNMVTACLHNPKVGAQPIRDLGAIRQFITSPTLASIFDAPWAIIFFITLFIINLTIGIVVVMGAIILLILAYFSQKIPAKEFGEANEQHVHSMQMLENIIKNAEVIKAMNLIENLKENWQIHNQNNLHSNFIANSWATVIVNFTKTYRMTLQIILTGLGAWLVINGSMSAGAIIAVNILAGKALGPFDASVNIYQGLTNVKQSYLRLSEIFMFNQSANTKIELPDPEGAITTNNLSYQEPTSQKWLIKDINIQITPGEAIGIIGPSGSGKTTLARLLVGVLNPTKGDVNIDGAAIHQWNSQQLASNMGYLPQSIELFDGMIKENIARMDKKATDKDIIDAATISNIHKYILSSFEDGYQTNVISNGMNLSSGQRQRIALARAFYGNPKIVILDEPNSSLDTEGEHALTQCIKNAKQKNITTLTIAHRPALLNHVDRIMVLRDGQIALFDTKDKVLKKLTAKIG
ncbi:MAG: type I secretion system permease/ATPase [Rhizobiales bacterium]|nr:type I secretion system permease/ATPase [Hyphomicrobiales bacterium]